MKLCTRAFLIVFDSFGSCFESGSCLSRYRGSGLVKKLAVEGYSGPICSIGSSEIRDIGLVPPVKRGLLIPLTETQEGIFNYFVMAPWGLELSLK